MVGQWKKEILESASTLFDTRRGPKPAETDTGKEDRLYGEIGRLKMEVDWPKKVGLVSPLVRGAGLTAGDRLPVRRQCVLQIFRAPRSIDNGQQRMKRPMVKTCCCAN